MFILESISDFFGNLFDSIGDFFGSIADWMNDNMDWGAPYVALITVVGCAVAGIIWG